MFNASTIPVLEQVVSFTQERHGVLAGNLANLDTPGYRTKDLSPGKFQERLREAIDARSERASQSSIGRYAAQEEDQFASVQDSMRSILYHDDSDVSLEKQVTEIAKNQMEHNLALTIMASQFRLMQTAISERVA